MRDGSSAEVTATSKHAGRWLLHEHPEAATSWDLEAMHKLAMEEGVRTSVADQCMYGLETWDKKGRPVPARKRTKFMTNCPGIAEELATKCNGKHQHEPLTNGRAQWAARYPKAFCKAICVGLMKEIRNDVMKVKCLLAVTHRSKVQQEGDSLDEMRQRQQDGRRERGVEHHEDSEPFRWENAWDDVTGEILEPKEVVKARAKELGYIKDKRVWKIITRREAIRRGIKIVQTRWIDVNKGDRWCPNYRSRFVAKEFNTGKDAGLFAATPPLEALRLLVSEAATVDQDHQEEGARGEKVMMVNDIARAFFEAPMKRDLCVELPDEVKLELAEDGEDYVGLLRMSLYGTRDAAANFQTEVRSFMAKIGFVVGRYNVCTYYHKERGIRTLVHGDDFVSTGTREEVRWFNKMLEQRFEVKTKVIGRGKGEDKEGKVLNRVIRVTEEGWEYEADQRHGEMIVNTLNLQEAKGVSSPGEEDKPWRLEEESRKLEGELATEFRALAARANYLALDRADIQYATKEVCRGMAQPTVGDRRKLKRLARYRKDKPRMITRYPYQKREADIEGYADSDWAGCKRTAKSTSGGVVLLGRHCIKSWSATQRSVTLSSGEAELVAAVKLCTELIGLTQLAFDWGLTYQGKVFIDSAAALGVAHRRGNGKLRHVKVGMLWIQRKIEDGEIDMNKVAGEENPADLMTKYLPFAKILKFTGYMNQHFQVGRAEAGLQL